MKLMLVEVNGVSTAVFVGKEVEPSQLIGATSATVIPEDATADALTDIQKAHVGEVMHGCLAAFGIKVA